MYFNVASSMCVLLFDHFRITFTREVIGPTLGGVLSEFYDFPTASSFMALIALVTLIVLLIALLFQRSSSNSHPNDDSGWSSLVSSTSSSFLIIHQLISIFGHEIVNRTLAFAGLSRSNCFVFLLF